ncbi:hypothetical protein HYPSUDRAFT_669213 [Hypholoma sublateritium FD-334 SS-4]|uniref:Uncharacterized protein n=1 Tax=Hypholoma sublateritium (strain FD-334 SS-4) TaxID=945553 RepID=A0A0D2NTL8_HYPSF|nr:hypothetical protein HYPSUDRAFT_669213 [Hypholoma sublateritium FD-334 SS-4]
MCAAVLHSSLAGFPRLPHWHSWTIPDDRSPFVGPRLHEIAKVFRVLKECLADLERYYSELTAPIPPASRNLLQHQPLGTSDTSPSALFPHFQKFTHATTRHCVELEYTQRLLPQYTDKAIFKALARSSDSHVASTVVVKFTPTYCQKAHDLLQKNSLAPHLWHRKNEETLGIFLTVKTLMSCGTPYGYCTKITWSLGTLEVRTSSYPVKASPCSLIVTSQAEQGKRPIRPTLMWMPPLTGIQMFAVVGSFIVTTICLCLTI